MFDIWALWIKNYPEKRPHKNNSHSNSATTIDKVDEYTSHNLNFNWILKFKSWPTVKNVDSIY